MTPPISIVTPSFNQGRYIERTIESVLGQDVPGLEYVIMDGGSTDQTVEILRRYDGRLRWTSGPDGGHSDAINKGIAATHGDIVGWLNSDDVYFPGALQRVVGYFAEHPEAEVVYGDAHHIDAEDHFIEHYPTEPWSYERLKELCFISQPATFLRRQVARDNGPLDTSLRYCMDYDYWFRLAGRGVRFSYLPELLAATRLHDEAATLAQRIECHVVTNDITRRHLGRTPDKWIFNYAHAVVERDGKHQAGKPWSTYALTAVSLYAALRWNRCVSPSMLRTLGRWLAADTVRALGQVARR
ncbi:MAG: glycosyltransferase [Chloroflexi bacterium]|nr:glycosyltransferase [Chloroflexota bacterium]